MKRPISVTSNSMYLTDEQPVFVNRISESFQLEQHQHEFIEFNYVSEGRGYHYIEGNTIPVVKGDLFYLPIGVSHVFRPATSDPEQGRLIVYNCIFNEVFASNLLRMFEVDDRIYKLLSSKFPDQTWLHLRDRKGVFQQAFNLMFEEFRQRESNYLTLVQAEVIRLLIYMTRYQESDLAAQSASVNLPRATDMVLDNIAKKISEFPSELYNAQQFADEAGVSERHFRRLFKERIGMTFIEYLHKCRIEHSCELLCTTTDKVSTIAQKSGYQDIKFYYRLFKKLTGISPNAYRVSNYPK